MLAALAIALGSAPAAGAATVTLGPTEIAETGFAHQCGGCPLTLAQRSSPFVNVAPAAGIITSWRVAGKPTVALRVLQPGASARWQGAGTSAAATNYKGLPNGTELPIAPGDLIGADLEGSAWVFTELPEASGLELLTWEPRLEEGEFHTAKSADTVAYAMLSAEVELTPVVSSVSPATGSNAGGQTVTIAGKYLDTAVNVLFGSHPAASFSVAPSGESITAVTPASAVGAVDVHVSNQHSTSETVSADKYTFLTPIAPSPGAQGGSPNTGAPKPGTAALAATAFSQSAPRWRLGTSLPHIARTPVGTTFAFELNEAGSLALVFTHVLPGRRVRGSCVAPGQSNQSKPRCKRRLSAGSLALAGHAGLNKVSFQGRLSRTKRLAPGNYVVALTTHDSHGLKALTPSLSFAALP